MNLYLPPLLRTYVSRFVYFPALGNHLCRVHLHTSDDMAMAEVYSSEDLHRCAALPALHQDLYVNVPVQATHAHPALCCYTVAPLQQRFNPPPSHCSTSVTHSPELYRPHPARECTPYTVERHTMLRPYLFGSSDQTVAELLPPIAKMRPHNTQQSA